MQPDYLTTEQLAERFGVNVTTIRAWVRAGRIPFFRPSRRVIRFNLADVEAAIRQGGEALSRFRRHEETEHGLS